MKQKPDLFRLIDLMLHDGHTVNAVVHTKSYLLYINRPANKDQGGCR